LSLIGNLPLIVAFDYEGRLSMSMQIESAFLTIAEAAKWTTLSESALRSRIQRDELPVHRLGHRILIDRNVLHNLIVGSPQ